MDFSTSTTSETLKAHLNDNKENTATSATLCAKCKQNMDSVTVNEMTSKDYYFDSYAHFGIHEVISIFIFSIW